ncbi:hypothetical protein LIER_34358 [Lithospermum erythrorhizon]|uniref:RPN1 N-terminal domain-containing protein n=1 Tax=Lithospermum erythrorhizon TaxID=34254 RepID=A0AAV3S2D2_LITER
MCYLTLGEVPMHLGLLLGKTLQQIRTLTSSMTTVPKPIKFLRPHYGTLKTYYEKMTDADLKRLLADILSVLALTMSAEGERGEEASIDDLMELVQQIVAFHMKGEAKNAQLIGQAISSNPALYHTQENRGSERDCTDHLSFSKQGLLEFRGSSAQPSGDEIGRSREELVLYSIDLE